MSDHHVSDDGLNIVCTAPEAANCRTRIIDPDCQSETWDEDGCNLHEGKHKPAPGQNCWQIEWVNASDLEDSFEDFRTFEVLPGAAVVMVWQYDFCGWNYEEGTPDD